MSEREELIEALVEEMPWYISTLVRFQVAVAHQIGIPVTDLHALAALLETGPVGAGRLAELMGMTSGAITRMVDRLERGGFVRRGPDPEDRRRVVVSVVPERVAEIARFYEPMGVEWRGHVDQISDDNLRFLLGFLRREREQTQAETARLRTAGRPHGTRRRKSQ
ncbi:MarR family winged helix-turn-helix transcriptional regulator [Actinomadura madurae]|uniref:MarR family winged helix-turn-helix transcriptional regulator n=1 Tax=Actinomadura madurae TaxID=1993 RepID=UPI000D835528|nr:MarR family transcriptional regulator [Actinomadura madurae]SPT60926.1 DNA-binding transcriptional repressor MarR [Actinomadura madurae]